jgi:hypothetical protein
MKNEPAPQDRRPPSFSFFRRLIPLGAQALHPCNSVEDEWIVDVTDPETDLLIAVTTDR